MCIQIRAAASIVGGSGEALASDLKAPRVKAVNKYTPPFSPKILKAYLASVQRAHDPGCACAHVSLAVEHHVCAGCPHADIESALVLYVQREHRRLSKGAVIHAKQDCAAKEKTSRRPGHAIWQEGCQEKTAD